MLEPPGPADAEEILATLAARDEQDFGDPTVTRDELTARWRVPGFAAEHDSVIVHAGRSVAAYAGVLEPGTLAFVHPHHEGRGLGAALLGWARERERSLGREWHRQRTAEGNARAAALLHGAGYLQPRTVWVMVHDLSDLRDLATAATPAPWPAPDGVTLDRIDPAADAEALHAADGAAFAENADYRPERLEEFRAEHVEAPDLHRAASLIARRRGSSEIAGFVVCQRLAGDIGYVDLLAVAPGERRRGLGGALLTAALCAFADAGRREARLEVASDNPSAMRLYERAGMRRRHGIAVWEQRVSR